MKTPVYTRYEYVDATSFSQAAAQLAQNVGLLAGAAIVPGLGRPDVVTTSIAGLVLTVNLPAPFTLLNSAGVLASAHGTVTNQDTSTYTVNFASLIPGSGSVTAYLRASITTVSQDPYQVVGPPAGHPSYVPSFAPFTAYATSVDTIQLTASLSAANNTTTFELGRVTLTSATTTLPALDTTNQILTAPLPIQNTVGVTGNKSLTRMDAGVAQRADGAGQVFTLPDALLSQGENFIIIARGGPTTLQRATAGNLIYGVTGDPSTGVTSVVIPKGDALTVNSDGVSFQAISSNSVIGSAAYISVNVAGSSNVTLTLVQASAAIIELVGAITGNINIFFPAGVAGVWSMRRSTTGNFGINAQTAGPTGSVVPLNAGSTLIEGTGANIFYAGANFATQAPGDSTTNAATTAFVTNAFSALTVVNTFNTRSGAVTLTSGDVTTALGYSPVQSFNTRTGTVTLLGSDVTTALGFVPVNNGSISIIGSPFQLMIDGGAGNFRRFGGSTGGVTRWLWGTLNGAESGGDTGSNWTLQNFTDSGLVKNNVLTFRRDSGIGTFASTPTFPTQSQNDNSTDGATTAYVDRQAASTLSSAEGYADANFLNLTGGFLSGNLQVGDGTGSRQVIVNGAAGSFRTYYWQTAGSNRWHMRANNTAESGSNTGSDFTCVRYADDGVTTIGTAFSVIRSTGVMSVPILVTTTQAAADSSTNAATTLYTDRAANTAQTNAVNVVSSVFTGANQSLGTNGFQNILGGFVLMWGTGTMPNTGATVSSLAITFPGGGFPVACLGVTVTPLNQANAGGSPGFPGGGWPTGCANGISKTGFTAQADTLNYTIFNRTIPVSWFAWGH